MAGYQHQHAGYDEDTSYGGNTAWPSNQLRQYPEYPAPIQTSLNRSPPRRPVGPYGGNTSYGAQSQNNYAIPSTNIHEPQQQNAPRSHQDVQDFYPTHTTNSNDDFDNEPYDPRYATPSRGTRQSYNSQTSSAPLAANAAAYRPSDSPSPRRPGALAAGMTGYSENDLSTARSFRSDGYDAYMNPHDIADDDDAYGERTTSQAAKAGAGAGLGAGMFKAFGGRDKSGNYGSVPGGGHAPVTEKSEWLQQNAPKSRRNKYVLGTIGCIVALAIVAGVVAGVVVTQTSAGTSSSTGSTSQDLTIHSSDVQSLMNNKNLHKVFPGMDYTPQNAQYPACLTNPPVQNDVTMDVAVLSQLTPAIRLYGTDCDQTQMVLKAIEKLDMKDSLKVWLGVWLDSNSTSNDRQMSQMYQILDDYDASSFAGIIIGNEVLFREDLTETELAAYLTKARSKLKSKGINLPVSTSDLGDNWTAALAADSDIVMANVHPFFAGVKPNVAAAWTYTFFSTHDENLATAKSGDWPKAIISETGWPSEGGNDCGTGAKCPTKTEGSVAGIDEMNTYLDTWVCQQMANSSTYFWFEGFDQPWTKIFNDKKTGDYWEPHWGLMDVDRNLKPGLKIPDCGGKTVTNPYGG